MKEQQELAINYLKTLDVNACITGSCLLEYFEGSDIDVFAFDEAAFTKLLYTLKFNPMFTILDKMEIWKASDWCDSTYKGSIKKMGIVTIKLYWNLSVPVNIIFKEKANNTFSVLESFDISVICKAYDLKTKQTLDLTNGDDITKKANFNKWNKSFYNPNIWAVSRILRQLERCFKYHSRGYDTDNVALKYKEILNSMLEYENIFNSAKVDEKVTSVKTNSKILIKIIDNWLEHHKISETELELLRTTIKLL